MAPHGPAEGRLTRGWNIGAPRRAVSRRGAARGDDRQLAPHGYLDRFTAPTRGSRRPGVRRRPRCPSCERTWSCQPDPRCAWFDRGGAMEAYAGACTRRPNGPAEGRLTRGWNIGAPRPVPSSDDRWRTRMRQRLQARIDMLMENIALRHQLMVYERGRTARHSLSGNDRLLWCFLARFFSNWRDTLDIVQPATVTRWRRVRWWRHLLGGRRRRPGRPRIDPELQALILRMARENPRWGSMRILGELRHLGFELSNSTVRRYRGSAGDPAITALVDVLPEPRRRVSTPRRCGTRRRLDSLRLMGTSDRFTAATERSHAVRLQASGRRPS